MTVYRRIDTCLHWFSGCQSISGVTCRSLIPGLIPGLILALVCLCLTLTAGHADGRQPLLMEGKKTLFQKVLMRPNARISSEPKAAETQPTTPFSVMYVYGLTDVDGEVWLEVGTDQSGTVAGWVPASGTAEWRQNLTVAFTNPAGRQRTLMFRDRAGLEALLSSSDLLVQAETYREQIRKGTLPPDSPVISIEPENHIDLQKQFYLLPIMEAEEVYLDSGFPMTLLRVASVSEQPPEEAPPEEEAPVRELRSAVTFVIDATTSMGPYIDQVRQSVEAIYRNIDAAGIGEQVSFGLVAYRDSLEKAPGLEYTTCLFADPNEVRNAEDFLNKVASLAPAKASSTGFDEDAYAGVQEAISAIDWSGFTGRYVILVTDAGAREGYDPLSGTGLSSQQMQQLVRNKDVYLYVMHLKTPAGASNHESAANQYRALSQYGEASDAVLYFPVQAGTVGAFAQVVESLGDAIIAHVRRTREDHAAQEAEIQRRREEMAQAQTDEERARTSLAYNTAVVGLAIQLRYLGQIEGDRAPSVFDAWMTDRSFRDPDLPVLDVRALLTKNQLSDLQQTLARIIDVSESGQVSPQNFFSSLQAAAAAMGRDPDRINQAESLAETGIVGEYLDGLPYRSEVMNITQDIWTSWGVGQQQQFIDTLNSKVALYRRFHDDTENWVLLNPAAPAGEAVYPVPLDTLP